MNRIKNYTKRFFKEDEGAELIEWAIIVAIAAMLVVTAFTIASNMNNGMADAGDKLSDAMGKYGDTPSDTPTE